MNPGHTLVIPRRHVETYFAATPEEHAELWRAVEEIKRSLDEELHPDGYNVGFNAGEAAGQTVMHLHIHVIPRFRGDVDDPSRHDEVEIWWPRDPPSFAPRRRDLLRERHELVADLIGANLQLPEGDSDARIAVEDLARQTNVEREDPADIYDAFRPIRALVGESGLVSEQLYNDMRTSQAEVVSGVSIVSARHAFAFLAVSGLARSAPRWVFLDGLEAAPITDLAAVADRLRVNLHDDPPGLPPTDPKAAELVARFVKRLEAIERLLLPVRRQRALALAEKTLDAWRERAWHEGDEARHQLIRALLGVVQPQPGAPHADLATVAEAWIRLVRPYQQEALRHRRSRKKPWTLNDLEGPLRERPIPMEQLKRAFQELPMVPTVGERVVAMIVGVPEPTPRRSEEDNARRMDRSEP